MRLRCRRMCVGLQGYVGVLLLVDEVGSGNWGTGMWEAKYGGRPRKRLTLASMPTRMRMWK